MENPYGFANDLGVKMPKFENMVITLRSGQSRMLEKRLNAMGYRLHGKLKGNYDKFLYTLDNGSYYFSDDIDRSYSIKFKPVNYKDIAGSQITTVDFFIGFLIGFFVCLILNLIF